MTLLEILFCLVAVAACSPLVAPDRGAIAGVVVADGNSLTSRVSVLHYGAAPGWFEQLSRELGADASRLHWANVAEGSNTTAMRTAAAPAAVDSLVSIAGAVHVVVIWEIINDLFLPGQSVDPATAINHLVEYSAARRRRGWRVIVVPAIACAPAGIPRDVIESRRELVNTWLRKFWRLHFDGFVDLAAAAEFSSYERARTDRALYLADGVHLTADGQTRVAQLMRSAIAAEISRRAAA